MVYNHFEKYQAQTLAYLYFDNWFSEDTFWPLTNTKCRRKKLCGISKYITFIQHYSDYKFLENHLATNRQRIFCNHFATMLLKKSVFMHLSRLFVVPGQARLSSRGKTPYPLPISPKTELGRKKELSHELNSYSIHSLYACNPLFFKAFSLLYLNKKRPHRKVFCLSTRSLN